jgi:tRNA (cytidine/uridine-2'-O-)-methyltransferase
MSKGKMNNIDLASEPEMDAAHWPHPQEKPLSRADVNVVLFQPEIPENTGNIGRTCAITGAALHLIEPLGFDLFSRKARRSGLDYWDKLHLYVYRDWEDFLAKNEGAEIYLATTKGSVPYTEVAYPKGVYLVFGRESAGLPDEIHAAYPGRRLRIPMRPEYRSFNLSNSVAVMVFEVLRQQGFPGMD